MLDPENNSTSTILYLRHDYAIVAGLIPNVIIWLGKGTWQSTLTLFEHSNLNLNGIQAEHPISKVFFTNLADTVDSLWLTRHDVLLEA